MCLLVDAYRQSRSDSASALGGIIAVPHLVSKGKHAGQNSGCHPGSSCCPYHHRPFSSRSPNILLGEALRRCVGIVAEGRRCPPQFTPNHIAATGGACPAQGAKAFGGEGCARHGKRGYYGVIGWLSTSTIFKGLSRLWAQVHASIQYVLEERQNTPTCDKIVERTFLPQK